MSGIAEVMHNLGYKVQGSDVAEGYVVEGLRERGIPVAIGHKAENLGDAAVVVDLDGDQARQPRSRGWRYERRVPVVRRAEMLAELMRLKSTVAVAGTHGKTTTTSMVAALLDAGGVDPTVINGGIINSYGSNARLGDSDWMVVEADEERRQLPAARRHDRGRHQHRSRASRSLRLVRSRSRMPMSSSSRTCPSTARRCSASIIPKCRRSSRACATGGSSPMASPRRPTCAASTSRRIPGGNRFEAIIRDRDGTTRSIENIELPMPGRHNVQNALAAIGVALELGIPDDDDPAPASPSFGGVKRRFTKVGEDARRHRDRRLRPPPGRDHARCSPAAREGAEGQGDRRRPAAPLHAPARSDGRLSARPSTTPTSSMSRRSTPRASSRSRA